MSPNFTKSCRSLIIPCLDISLLNYLHLPAWSYSILAKSSRLAARGLDDLVRVIRFLDTDRLTMGLLVRCRIDRVDWIYIFSMGLSMFEFVVIFSGSLELSATENLVVEISESGVGESSPRKDVSRVDG